MVSTALWDAVTALNNKIKVSAGTATPEELAYLGSAIEKIGGQVSLIDLANHVESIKELIDMQRVIAETQLNSTASSLSDTTIASIHETIALVEAELAATVQNRKTELTIAVASAEAQLTDITAAKVTELNTAATALNDTITLASDAMNDLRAAAVVTEEEMFFFSSF